jgi:hypothetical protein
LRPGQSGVDSSAGLKMFGTSLRPKGQRHLLSEFVNVVRVCRSRASALTADSFRAAVTGAGQRNETISQRKVLNSINDPIYGIGNRIDRGPIQIYRDERVNINLRINDRVALRRGLMTFITKFTRVEVPS